VVGLSEFLLANREQIEFAERGPHLIRDTVYGCISHSAEPFAKEMRSTVAGPNLVLAGKNSVATSGARALRGAADARGFNNPIFVVANRADDGKDDWQPSLKRFAQTNDGFTLVDLADVYTLPDLYFFSLEFDRIFKTVNTTSQNLFNIHFSLLPAYKGMYTSALPIMRGETTSGVTLHRIERGIDTGPIISQVAFPIDPDDTARDLYFKYLRHGSELFGAMVGKLLDNEYRAIPQSAAGSSYYGRATIDYANLAIDLMKTAEEVRNQIRAFTFPEYQTVTLDDLEIYTAEFTDVPSGSKPGSIVSKTVGVRHLATIDYDLRLVGKELARSDATSQPLGR
jgi:methionyl-tRNA formyltransferase